jgi:hypothetical protein
VPEKQPAQVSYLFVIVSRHLDPNKYGFVERRAVS